MMKAIAAILPVLAAIALAGCGPSSGNAQDNNGQPIIITHSSSSSGHDKPVIVSAQPDAPTDTNVAGTTAIASTNSTSVKGNSGSATSLGGKNNQPDAPKKEESAEAKFAKSRVSVRDVMKLLKSNGILVADRMDGLSPSHRRAFLELTQRIGGVDTGLLWVTNSFGFIAVAFSDAKRLDSLLESPPEMLLYHNIVMVPAGQASGEWDRISRIIVDDGGERIRSNALDSQVLLNQLEMLRTQIELYQRREGGYPDFVAKQWQLMTKGKYVNSPPRNPLASDDVADRVEVVTAVGLKGDSVSRKRAGWVWNSTDNKFYPAGFSEDELNKFLNGAPGGKYYIALPEMHVMARANHIRSMVERAIAARKLERKMGFPSLSEVLVQIEKAGAFPENPMNRSSEIQVASWQRIPPVTGGAGWNYDEKTGKVWANSNLVRENEL